MLEPKMQETFSVSQNPGKRLGIHYFADSAHYNHSDLERWLPKLRDLGMHWITLQAPLDRAIPQEFITALLDSGIQPILHFLIPLERPAKIEELAPMFKAYAAWGVQHVVLFDRPNLRAQWPGTGWTQRGLVDRFLKFFLPLAKAALEAGLTPVFPPLEPGGDYWDTAFLRAALEAIAKQTESELREHLALAAYAWAGDKPLDWGAGGPESWPASLPYSTPPDSQDQRGLRIFDWYNAISRAELDKELPIFLVAAGMHREETETHDENHAARVIEIAKAMESDPDSQELAAVPANVMACNLWLLAAEPAQLEAGHAWFNADGEPKEIAKQWMAWRQGSPMPTNPVAPNYSSHSMSIEINGERPIRHYLLLPGREPTAWLFAEFNAYLSENQPTIGYSMQEAQQAGRVTLAGGLQAFSDEMIRALIEAGCQVDSLQSNGGDLAN